MQDRFKIFSTSLLLGVLLSLSGCGADTQVTCSTEPHCFGLATLQFGSDNASVPESAGTVQLTVNRTGGTSGAVSVSYATANGTAVAGTDYTASSGTLSWAAGDSTAKTISVPVIDEQLTSGSKTFGVTLSAPTGGAALGTPSTATVTITDNDVVPGTIQLSASGYSTSESAGTVTLTVNRTGGTSGAVSVSYATSNGTAVAGTDYTAASGTLSWAAGDNTAKTISVPVTDEHLTSGSKTFGVTLSAATGGATLGTPSTATVTITDNDVVPGTIQLSASSYSTSESAGTVTLQVNRTGGTSGAVSVSYATSNGTAAAGTDYTASSGTLSWAAGDNTAKTISVPVTDEHLTSGSKTFGVTLSAPTGGATLGAPSTATVTITDNDVVPGTIQLSASSYSTSESAGTVTLQVNRTAGTSGAVSVSYATSNGTAAAGTDYTASSGTLSWAAGDNTAKTISVPVTDEHLTSGSKTFGVTLSAATGGATLGTPSTATVTITDNDVVPGTIQLSASSYSTSESAGTVTLQVNRTGGTSGAVSVSYATSNGTAAAGTDYTASSGTLSWAAGDNTAKTISVPVTDEHLTSGSKTFGVTLSAPTGGATLGAPSTATVTITDNDVVPGTIQLSASSYSTSESAGTVTLQVNRTGGTSGAVSVSYATSNGTAAAGTDYTASSGTLSWAAGDNTAKTISVPVTDEHLTSGSKTFGVTLSAPTGGATLGAPSTATVTITDNDVVPGTIAFSASTYSVDEGAATIVLMVTRTGGDSGAATVSYKTVNGTAVAGTAYTTTAGTLSWADGDSSSKSITVPILNPGLTSGSQSFVVNLSGATGAVLGIPATATVTITDDDVIVADCGTYSYSGDQHLCQINSVAAPNAVAVRVSPTADSANQPIVVLPANGSGITVYLSVITTKYFAPATYSWSQVQPVIDSYASKATAAFSNTTTATPQVTALLPTSGIYQFQVTATDVNSKTLSAYVWVNVWDSKPAIAPGNIGLNPGIAPPSSVAMLSADPGPFKHPRLLFSAGDWATLSAKADADNGTPEVLAGLAELRASMSKNFDNPGTAMNQLEGALLKYAADGYSTADYSAICTLIGFTPGSTAGSPPSAVVPGIIVSARDSALGTDTDTYFSDGLAAASYLAWLAVDPTQPSNPTSAGSQRLAQLGTMTAALSQFLLTTELAYPALYTGSNSGTLANYSLAMAYDLTYNSMTTEEQSQTRDYLYTIGNLYDTQGGGIGLYSAEPKTVPPSTGQNGVDFPNLADGLDSPALVIEGEEGQLSSAVTGNPAFGTYVAAANSTDPNVTPVSSWPYANQSSVRNLERQIRANSEYILTPWGFYHNMEAYFQLGQNVSAVGTYAYARRGENQWVSTYLYQALLQALYNIVPEQNNSGLEQILDHQDGSGFAGGGAQRNFYYLSKAMYPDDPMIDYIYRQATAGNGENALARAIFGQLLQTSDLSTVAQAKRLGLTKFDPLLGFAISRNGWNQSDLSLVMMNFTLGGGHYHAEANSFTFSALGRVWSCPPQYHVVPGDAQQQIMILNHPGATDASGGYVGQGPSSYDNLHDEKTPSPFHGVLLDVSEDQNGLWTWFVGTPSLPTTMSEGVKHSKMERPRNLSRPA